MQGDIFGEDFELLSVEDALSDGSRDNNPDTQQNITSWLKPTEFDADSSELKKHILSYMTGTGDWIRKTEQYTKWSDEGNGMLWIKGVPGSGKSVVAASIIAKLIEENVPVLYFFFRHIVQSNRSPEACVRDCLAQLLPHSNLLFKRLRGLMGENKTIETISINTLWTALLDALAKLPKVYVVVDALDEMDSGSAAGNEAFLQRLMELGDYLPHSVKVLVTSRPSPHIENLFHPSVPLIRLDPQNVKSDIESFLRFRSRSLAPGIEADVVQQAISTKVGGLFLYARLMMDELIQCDSDEVEEKLRRMPLSLDQVYNSLFREHSIRSGVDRNTQMLIMQWVTHSVRPLRLIELATVVKILPEREGMTMQRAKALIRASCGPLLEVLENETVQIIHHSLTEFLLDTSRFDVTADYESFPLLDSIRTHSLIAITCLTYATQPLNTPSTVERDYLGVTLLKSYFQDYPLLQYASSNWIHHASKSQNLEVDLISLVDIFFSAENPNRDKCMVGALGYSNCQSWNNLTYEQLQREVLVCACRFGLVGYVKILIQRGVNFDTNVDSVCSPIEAAAMGGSTEIVSVLLENGLDPDAYNRSGLTALQAAASENKYEVARTLLNAGADPHLLSNKPYWMRLEGSDDFCSTALGIACANGNVETVVEIKKYYEKGSVTSEFHLAIRKEQVAVVQTLLDSEHIPLDDDDTLEKAILSASTVRSLEIINFLIKKGQGNIVSVLSGRSTGALHAVCGAKAKGENDAEIVKLLLRYGCNVDEEDDQKRTPLMLAIGYGKATLARILLENGAILSFSLKDGGNAWHVLCSAPDIEDFEIVKIVAEANVDVNVKDKNGRTPLMLALLHGCVEAWPTLLDLGADLNARDNQDNTPLFFAMEYGKPRNTPKNESYRCSIQCPGAVDELLKRGADVMAKNINGETCLFNDSFSLNDGLRDDELVRRLIDAGLEVDAQNVDGCSVVHHFAKHSDYSAIASLKDMGANLSLRDKKGRTVLHYLLMPGDSYDPHYNLNYVKDWQIDLLATDIDGNTALHTAMEQENESISAEVLRSLQKMGIQLSAKNKEGKTAFHLALESCTNKYPSPAVKHFLSLLDPDDADIPDNSGTRPIHLAAGKSESFLLPLLKKGVRLDSTDEFSRTPLHLAARAGSTNCVEIIYQKSPETINSLDFNGLTPLHCACLSGSPETVDALLFLGANVEDAVSLFKICIDALEDRDGGSGSSIHGMRPIIRSLASFVRNDELDTLISKLEAENIRQDILKELLAVRADKLNIQCIQISDDVQKEVDSMNVDHHNFYELFKTHKVKSEILGLGILQKVGLESWSIPHHSGLTLWSVLHTICDSGDTGALGLLTRFYGYDRIKDRVLAFDETYPLLFCSTHRQSTNLNIMKRLLDLGVDVNAKYTGNTISEGRLGIHREAKDETALHRMTQSFQPWKTAGIKLLLDYGANLHLADAEGHTPLLNLLSCQNDFPEMASVTLLLKHGANPNVMSAKGITPLNVAAKHGLEVVELLLECGANVNVTPCLPIVDAIHALDVDVVKLFLKNDADISLQDSKADDRLPAPSMTARNATPLLVIATRHASNIKSYRKLCAIAEVLFEHGADPWALIEKDLTVFHTVVEARGSLRPFFEYGININRQNPKGETPLMAACKNIGHRQNLYWYFWGQSDSEDELVSDNGEDWEEPSNAEYVLQHDPDVTISDNASKNVLHHLVTHCEDHTLDENNELYKVILKDILERISDPAIINQMDSSGKNPIHYALEHGNLWTAKKLLERISSVSAVDSNGNCFLHLLAPYLAVTDKAKELWQLLRDRGASLDCINHDGNRPIFLYLKQSSIDKRKYKVNSLSYLYHFNDKNRPKDEGPRLLENFHLLDDGNLKCRNNQGETLLHIVAGRRVDSFQGDTKEEIVDMFKLLLEKGLDPRAEDNRQQTPLDLAMISGHSEILELFARRSG